jgi:hypothetical protein
MLKLEGADELEKLILPDEDVGEVFVECDKCHEKYWATVFWGTDDFYHLWKGYLHGCEKDGYIRPVVPWQIHEVAWPMRIEATSGSRTL